MDLSDLRREYQARGLDVGDTAEDPFEQFAAWFAEIEASELPEPNAMVLATVDTAGRPSVRHLLAKAVDSGFVFYTNYESRKGVELAANANAAIVFAWSPFSRQVIAEGRVERLDAAASDAYFARRPRSSQLSAWASAQSRVLEDRAALEAEVDAAAARFHGRDVPRPAHWGGYRLTPDRIEFWQGRPNRLHDRIVYEPDGDGWKRRRLNP